MNNKLHIFIARLLLLYFVTAIVPLDFYHHHAVRQQSGRQGISSPKGYTRSVTDLCLICHFHLNAQSYPHTAYFQLSVKETAHTRSYGGYQFKTYTTTLTHFNLRGPPATFA